MNKLAFYAIALICALTVVQATLPAEGTTDDGRNVTYWDCDNPDSWPDEAKALNLNIFDCKMYEGIIDFRIFSGKVQEGFEWLEPKFAEWDDDKTGGCSFNENNYWLLTTGNRTHARLFDNALQYFNIQFATKQELEEVHQRLDHIEAMLSLERPTRLELCLKEAQIRADRTGQVQWCQKYKVVPGKGYWVMIE